MIPNYSVSLSVLALFVLACIPFSCAKAQKDQISHTVVFYNVENLFDTLDDPNKKDEEYLPGSELKWSHARYEAKLDALAKVILAAGGGQPPMLIGLAEVENAQVVEALGRKIGGESATYGLAHRESPDTRGIDCALLYRNDKSGFRVERVDAIRLNFPDDSAYTSRDILHVTGKLKGVKQPLHVFVNHWPSRTGGEKESEGRRIVAATALRAAVDSLRVAEQNPLILAMGDFNDEPDNRSLGDVLGAATEFSNLNNPAQNGALMNLMGPADSRGEGSYNYQGNWNMIDQFVVSSALVPSTHCPRCCVAQDAAPFREEWMMYKSERYGPQPNRTYGGPNYYGGYSDHLPIRLTLSVPH